MTSKHSKAWNQVRHLHSASEGLRKDGDPSSSHKREKKAEREKETASADPGEEPQNHGEEEGKEEEEEEGVPAFSDSGETHGGQEEGQEGGKKEGASASSEPGGEQRRDHDEGREGSRSPSLLNPLSEGVDKQRQAQLRGQLRAQFSIWEQQEGQSPGSQLAEPVGRVIPREGDDGALPEHRDVDPRGQCPTCGQCNDPAGCSNGLPADVEKTLQRELAVLKGEVTASIESMKREMAEELSSLREALQVYNEHHFFQGADLSPLEELDENMPSQPKGGHAMILQGGKTGDKISLGEKFKSWSVPTLHPLPVASRNQAMLRAAMTTITAQNGFASSLCRSNSDPVEPMQAKSTILPPAVPKLASRKPPAKMVPPPTTRTYSSNAKYSNKISARTLAPHPPCGDSEGKPH